MIPEDTKGTNLVCLIKALALPGFAYGFRTPSLLATLDIRPFTTTTLLETVNNCLSEALPSDPPPEQEIGANSNNPVKGIAQLIIDWTNYLHKAANLPVFEQGRIIKRIQENKLLIALPTLAKGHRATAAALDWLVTLINIMARNDDVTTTLDALPGLLKKLRSTTPNGSNVPRFLAAAHQMDIPYTELPGQIFQYGQGVRCRWLESSFTDETPHIAAKLARSKVLAATVLRQAGIPVPRHYLVHTASTALQAAQKLGYPVVVKPADLDGGVGVAAGLSSPDEVLKAFATTQKHSKNVLVEKHFEGRDYRLTVFQGELIWAVERIPGGVTGDGISTIKTLVEQLNADPRRGKGSHAPLKRLILEDEAHALLLKAGLDTESIPAAKEFIRLRRSSNIANGGTPIAVFEQVHPDNRFLAIRAAAALRLDLAGVDLLIPDVSRSWKETGAAICEVNGQPNLGQTTAAHLYKPILNKLVGGNGRVPIAVIFGAEPDSELAASIAARLLQKGMTSGRSTHGGVFIGRERIINSATTPYDDGKILMTDKTVDAIILNISDDRILRSGLPFDHFDVLVLAGSKFIQRVEHSSDHSVAMKETLNFILPACRGKVFNAAESGLTISFPSKLTTTEWGNSPIERNQLVDTVVASMLAANTLHLRDTNT